MTAKPKSKSKSKSKSKPRYTKREKHLMLVIAHLRGSACDAWARLNFIVTRREQGLNPMSLEDALKRHAPAAQLEFYEDQMRTPLMGAGLPWFESSDLPPWVAREQEKVLDERSKWSKNKLIESGNVKR